MLLFALKMANEKPDYLEVIIIIIFQAHYGRPSSAKKTLMLRNMEGGGKGGGDKQRVDLVTVSPLEDMKD